jgi:acyl transferase domain-containing protein
LGHKGQLEQKLRERGVACQRLETSHTFHSQMMDPILAPFLDYVRRFRLNPPTVPFALGGDGSAKGALAHRVNFLLHSDRAREGSSRGS